MADPAQVQALIAGDQGAFEQLITALMGSDNQSRQAAEGLFNQMKEANGDACVTNLVALLRTSPQQDSRTLTAVLLRKVLTKDDPPYWAKLSPATQALVKSELLNSVKDEQLRSVSKKICDTLSELAGKIPDVDKTWPELLPFIFSCVQSGDPRLMEAALNVFAELARSMMTTLMQYMGTLHQVLMACLSHQNTTVRIAAMRATCSFILDLDESSDRDKFQSTTGPMMECIMHSLNVGEEGSAQEALEMFIEVAESHPRFLRRQLQEVVAAMLQFATAENLEEATRQLAAEFLVVLCEAREKAPGMMRKLPTFSQSIFHIMLNFLLDIEDEPEWHQAESDAHETDGEGELYEFGQECLDRIALSLGGAAVMPIAIALLPQWAVDPDWKKRHAALICLAQIAEGCVKVMMQHLDSLVSMSLKGLQDQHAKVRWAACQALGQMCTDLGPDLQSSQHARILPGLMAVMDDFSQPRVQAHASAAVVNFSENCDQDLLPPYLDTLISKLLTLLQRGQRIVQEGALTAMASVADCAKAHFERYYDSVMPLLRHLLSSASQKSHQLLRAKALECISLVGMAVGRDRFRADANEVMKFMSALQAQPLADDDPTSSYMLQAGARICKCLGEEFLPYMQVVMPPLLHSAQLKPDVHITDLESTSDNEDEDDEVETIYLGDRKISIRTSVLEEKATACNMLCCYADELKDGFYPWVEQVTQIMVPLLKFYFHEEVRQAAVQAMPELLRSASLAVTVGRGPDTTFVKQMLDFIWTPLMEAMAKEPDTEVLVTMLNAVEEIVAVVGPELLAADQLAAAFERFKGVFAMSEERRQERALRRSQEDFDEEEAEALQEENEAEEELLDAIATALTVVLKKFGDAAMPYVDALMPSVGTLLEPGRSEEERRIGVCVMDDILEHSPTGGAQIAVQALPILLNSSQAKDGNLRQCAVYGLGVAAQHQRAAFRPVAPSAVAALMAIIRKPGARQEDDAMATENAIGALGKILEYQSDAVDSAAVADAWLNSLPLTVDEVEAQGSHALLVRLIEQSDPRILGPGNKNLPLILSIIVRVLSKGHDLATDDTVQRMARLVSQVQASLPQDVFQGIFAQLSPADQAALQKTLSGQ